MGLIEGAAGWGQRREKHVLVYIFGCGRANRLNRGGTKAGNPIRMQRPREG